jgi:DNA repair protein RecN (Recombination protein N)
VGEKSLTVLRRLLIRDYLLADRLELDWPEGLVVLTGETGAGKSLLVDALGLVLGDRAEANTVRAGAARAEISAEFSLRGLPTAADWLREQGLDAEGDCLMRRVIEAEGRSRAFINGSPVTLAQMKALGEQLVDIHGQHAHHALLRSEAQRALLDVYAGAAAQVDVVRQGWQRCREAREQLRAAQESAAGHEAARAALEEDLALFNQCGSDLDDWPALVAEHARLAGMADLMAGMSQLAEAFDGEEQGVVRSLHQTEVVLRDLVSLDPALAPALQTVSGALLDLRETARDLKRHADGLGLDPARLAELERSMAIAHRLARKHHVTPAGLPAQSVVWQDRLASLDAAADLPGMTAALAAAEAVWAGDCVRLSALRADAAGRLATAVNDTLAHLALGQARFAVRLQPLPAPRAQGAEDVIFEIASHPALPAGALAQVASGGELSRISLAIQTALASHVGVATRIFDEVDVGIGGDVADAVGRLLAQLARQCQVLVITHLPQVAAWAAHHYRVVKQTGETVRSELQPLDASGREAELARMLGSANSSAGLLHAREMLARAAKR